MSSYHPIPNQAPPIYSSAQDASDLPDDFKYGVHVSDSHQSVRLAFVQKVYAILSLQLLGTCIVGAIVMFNAGAKAFIQSSTGLYILAVIMTFVSLFALMWKRRESPTNLYLLAAFTFFEAYTLGVTVSYVDRMVVLQALATTLGLFVGLTAYTFQSRQDFSGMGPFLYTALWGLVVIGLVQIFLPFNNMVDLAIASVSALVFAGYTVYDTYEIMHRTSCEEYVMASVELYLDVVNLFIAILRILNDLNSD